MSLTLRALLTAVVVLSVSRVSVAHHAFNAEFDAKKPILLKGSVTKMEWINPHAWIYLDAKGPDGKVRNWAVELGAPNALMRRGWRKNSMPAGSQIIVSGFLAKNATATVNGRDVTFSDGRKLFVGSSGTGAPDDDRRPR
jgi:hypothetical protein